MVRRSGATLVEVLVAIFIMAIGLLALLTLFPLGALTMADAIRNDRVASAASETAANSRFWQLHIDPNLLAPSGLPALNNGALATAFNPGGLGAPIGTPWAALVQPAPAVPGFTPGTTPRPSYPVFVDPGGVLLSGTIGAVPGVSAGIPRRGVSFVTTTQLLANWFTLPDDLTYTINDAWRGYAIPNPTAGALGGAPGLNPGGVQREGRYSVGVMLRRPDFMAPSVAEMTIVVFSGRPTPQLTLERSYPFTTFTHGSTSVIINWVPAAGQEKPALRPGSWILDATIGNVNLAEPYGFFYRVTGVSDVTATSMNIELQTPIKTSFPGWGVYPNTTAPAAAQPAHVGVLVVMENVAEVIEKGLVGVKQY